MTDNARPSFYTGLLRTVAVAVIGAVVGTIAVVSYRYVDPTVTLRDYGFRIAVAVGSVAALLCLCRTRRIRFSAADALILLFGGYLLVNGGLAEGGWTGERPAAIVAGLSLYFTVRVFAAFWPQVVRWIGLIVLLSGLYEGWVGLAQLAGYRASLHALYKFTGTFFNPGPYAGYIVAVSCFAGCCLLRSRRDGGFAKANGVGRLLKRNLTLENAIFGAGALMLLVCLLLVPASMSRSAWLSLGLTGTLVVLCETGAGRRVRKYLKEHVRVWFLLVPLGVALLTTIGVGLYALKQGSANGRLLIWNVSARMVLRHPLTGVGTGCFGPSYADAQARYLATLPDSAPEIQVAGLPDYAFNEYLHLLVEQGGVGLTLFLLVLFFTFRQVRPDRREFLYAAVAVLLFALSSYPFRVLPSSILFILCLAVLNGDKPGIDCRVGFAALSLATVGFSAGCLPKWGEALEAQREWARSRQFYRGKLYEAVAPDYENLYRHLSDESRFVYEYAYILNRLERYAESNRIIERHGERMESNPMFYNVRGNNYRALGEYGPAEASYRRAYALLPNRLYPLYLLTRLYFEQGDTVKGIRTARSVSEFDPKVLSPATESMKSEVRKLLDEANRRK